MDRQSHWQRVYQQHAPHELSWFQPEALRSLALIRQAAPDLMSRIIDVGGGASTLIDGLLAAGYHEITVLDISAAALAAARHRIGDGTRVTWIAADILTAALPEDAFDVWHDRAAFHFLTSGTDRARYVDRLRHALHRDGHVIVATFADDGPSRCSGLPVERYAAAALATLFGPAFTLVRSVREDHVTPSGAHQPFIYCVFRRSTSKSAV